MVDCFFSVLFMSFDFNKMKIFFLILVILGQLLYPQDIANLENNARNKKGNEKTEYLLKIADYYLKREPSKSLSAAKSAFENSETTGNKILKGRSLLALAEYHYLQGNNNEACGYFDKAAELFSSTGEQNLLSQTYSRLGVVKRVMGDFENALELCLKSLEMNRLQKDSSKMSENFNELGLIYRNLGEQEKSFNYLNEALTYAQKTGEITQTKRALNYIGNHYFFAGQIDKAEGYYKESLDYFIKDKITDDFYAGILNNLGNCNREKKDYKSALDFYNLALTISNKLGDKNLIAVIYKNIGITKKRQGEFIQALKYLTLADSLAKSIGLKRFQRDISLEISMLFKEKKMYAEALQYHIQFAALTDSIFRQDMSNKIKLYESRFEKQKAQESLTAYKLSQEIHFRNLLIIILILTIATAILLYYFYRLNKRSNRKINKQKEELLKLNKTLEKKNRQLEEFEDIVNRTKAIIVVWESEADFPIRFISKNVKNHLGYSDMDFISGTINWKNLIHPEDLERVNQEQKDFLNHKVSEYSQQYRLINSDGEYRWFEDHNKVIIDRGTNSVCLQAIVLDINERKELEQQLSNYTDELKELNKIKDKFFSIVAHDLKSPFLGLLGLSNMLKDNFDFVDVNQKKEYINEMNQMITRVYKLIENLLDWSRMQLNKYGVRIKDVNIKSIFDNIIGVININAAAKNISIQNLLPENLEMKSDEKMLTSMFTNIISNSIKFTNEKGTIKIYHKEEDGKLKITVEDNGVGISNEDIENIFKIDQKISTIGTAGEKGTGLGLIIAKEMTEKLGGNIYAESLENEWTKFTVALPLNGHSPKID